MTWQSSFVFRFCARQRRNNPVLMVFIFGGVQINLPFILMIPEFLTLNSKSKPQCV